MKRIFLILIQLVAAGSTISVAAADLTIYMDRAGVKVSPTLYGAFFEDINHAGDGGLYAEMVQNRSFEDNPCLITWVRLTNANSKVTFPYCRGQIAGNLKQMAGTIYGGAAQTGKRQWPWWREDVTSVLAPGSGIFPATWPCRSTRIYGAGAASSRRCAS